MAKEFEFEYRLNGEWVTAGEGPGGMGSGETALDAFNDLRKKEGGTLANGPYRCKAPPEVDGEQMWHPFWLDMDGHVEWDRTD